MRTLKYILVTVYIFLILLNTFFLFTFNSFSNSSFFDKTVIGLNFEVDDFNKGDLLFVSKDVENIDKNDTVLYYDTANKDEYIQTSKVTDVMKTNNAEKTFIIDGGTFISSEYVIGLKDKVIAIPLLGYLYIFFTSKIGYLLFTILPITICFIYQLLKYRKVGKHEKNKN